LGTFLANFCLNEGYKCKTCNKSMIEHQRKFVHKHARIEITTQIFVKPVTSDENNPDSLPPSFNGENDGILAWRRCPTFVFFMLFDCCNFIILDVNQILLLRLFHLQYGI
jgi:hypothetical protein